MCKLPAVFAPIITVTEKVKVATNVNYGTATATDDTLESIKYIYKKISPVQN